MYYSTHMVTVRLWCVFLFFTSISYFVLRTHRFVVIFIIHRVDE